MRREICKEITKDVFQEFYRAVSLNQNYILRLNRTDESVLEKFIDYVDDSYGLNAIDSEFLINWIESGFNYWFDIPTRFGRGIVMFSWVFGKKAIERYEKIKHKDNKLSRFNRKIRKEVGVKILNKYRVERKESHSNSLYSKMVLEGSIVEEALKKRHLNTDEAQVICVLSTTLYNHKSRYCLQCRHSESCKEILRKTYPKIHTLRGYARTTE